ncbi:hypothetical protein J057_14850 [Marinobacter nanhaiticus D15-8W]|uniref:EamA domain-containing protein n=1 Tax=Marinobacter nanhaiticus D15-8W TaxID=626887 RepID=N6VR78_9GAMM|nr:DMT family transporter [Marinobacter nanhaiticus]ENO12690.1 hypothetical protein J057_14850 [Marinobacter nanhaiticus D15-8W]
MNMPLLRDRKAMFFVFIAVIAGTVMDAVVKSLGQEIGTWQLLTMRWFFAILLLLPVLYRRRTISTSIRCKKIYFARAILNCIGSFALFYSLSTVPLAIVVTIMFAEPIFVIPFAILLLNERPSAKDIICGLFGFLAVVYINDTSHSDYSIEALAPIIAATSYALMHVLTKKWGAEENAFSLMFWLAISTFFISAPLSLQEWRPLDINVVSMAFIIAILGSIYSYFMIVGFRYGSVQKASQISYISVPVAFSLGWIFFDEPPTWKMAIGSLFILSTTLVVTTEFKTLKILARKT